MKRKTEPSLIDRGIAADRSVGVSKNTRENPEFLPKLGQTLCSINKTQFGRKRRDLEHGKDF